MTTVESGRQAEAVVATHLISRGYTIIALNWRTRWCEIDIVARKDAVIYFVEVKYRRNDHNGTGIDYITPTKLKQMAFAANIWVKSNAFAGSYELAAIEVSGVNFAINRFILI